MVDIRLITILPPAQQVTGLQPQSQISGGGGASAIKSLPPGTTLSGFIINRDAQGNPVLRTETGDIVFESQFFLKIGSEVEIRIQNIAGNNIARILSVNGQPPELAEAQSSFSQDPEVIIPPSLQRATNATPQSTISNAASPATLLPNTPPTLNLSATLLSTPPQPEAANPLPAGAQLTLRVTNLQLPISSPEGAAIAAQGQSSAPSAAQPYSAYSRWNATTTTPQPIVPESANSAASPLSPASSSGQTTQPSLAATNLPTASSVQNTGISTPEAQKFSGIQNTLASTAPTVPLTELEAMAPAVLRILASETSPSAQTAANSPTPNTQAQTAPLPTLAPQHTLPTIGARSDGFVIGHETSGEPLLESPLGLFRLPATAQLATGTRLSFEITEMPLPLPALQAAPLLTPAPLTQLAQSWSTLQDVFSLLLGGSLEDADLSGFNLASMFGKPTNSQPQGTPQPAGMLMSNLSSFIAALRTGDFRSWLGRENAKWLEDKGHGALVEKASAEFSSLAKLYNAPQPGQWQTLFFPIAVEGEIRQVRMFTKRERKKDSEGKPKQEDDTRFVIEMELSQLGGMQMDGFVRRKDESMQFDLVVRSLSGLPAQVQKDISDIFYSTAELTGYRGSLAFQKVGLFPVSPMEEVARQHFEDITA